MNSGQLTEFHIFPSAGSLSVKKKKSESLVWIISQFWQIRLTIIRLVFHTHEGHYQKCFPKYVQCECEFLVKAD